MAKNDGYAIKTIGDCKNAMTKCCITKYIGIDVI